MNFFIYFCEEKMKLNFNGDGLLVYMTGGVGGFGMTDRLQASSCSRRSSSH